jgi:hypothetical protein
VDIEQTVIGIDNVLTVNEQAEVAGLIGSDVQRKDSMDYRQRPAPTTDAETYEFINELGSKKNNVHQPAFVRQADRHQAVHVAYFALAPHRRRHARRHRNVS